MAREHGERRPISRRSFLKFGAVIGGALLTGAVFAEPKKAVATAEKIVVVPKAEVAKPKSDINVMQGVQNARIQKFIADSDALVRRYGHANYDPTKSVI